MPFLPDDLQAGQAKWRTFPRQRPADIVNPGPGQESVWDYPRPPRVESVAKRLCVEFGGMVLADTSKGLRVIETSSPPVYYFPLEDVVLTYLEQTRQSTFCEWKGVAHYWSIQVQDRVATHGAWSYPDPTPGYEIIRNYVAFYPSLMEACYVGDELATPQAGDFYGGWITPEITGPFKGEPGTEGW